MKNLFFGVAALALTAAPALARPTAPAPAAPANPWAICSKTPALNETFPGSLLGNDWKAIERPAKTYGDGSLEGYRPENMVVSGGVLTFYAIRDGGAWNSARIATYSTYKYGCFEVEARLPRGKGFWPALWMRTAFDQPMNGELDLMEGFGSHPGDFQATQHHWSNGQQPDFKHKRIINGKDMTYTCARVFAAQDRAFVEHWNPCTLVQLPAGTDFSSGFHRFGMIWTPTQVTWLLDGKPYYTSTDDVPQRAMALVMNLSVGAMDGGPDGSTPSRAEMFVKSVRVWPLAAAGKGGR